MSKYVITGINVVDGEVHNSVVALLSRDPVTNEIGNGTGRRIDRTELANLMQFDEVYILRWTRPGEAELGSRLRPKPGQMEFPMSVDEDGQPNGGLLEVARFNVGMDD